MGINYKTLFILSLTVFFSACVGQADQVAKSELLRAPMFDAHAETRIAALRELDKTIEEVDVAMLGDSHFELMDMASFNFKTINLGIRGDSVYAISQRAREYSSVMQAEFIALSLGTNNVALGVKNSITVQQISELISGYPDKKFFLALLNPLLEEAGYGNFNQHLLTINESLVKLYEKDERVVLIQPLASLDHENFKLSADLYQKDGIHLSEKGYELWVKQWKPLSLAIEDSKSMR